MKRIKCIVQYDGTHFSGFQIQPNGRTVQEEIEKGLAKMHKGNEVTIHASGRTDAGVHAYGQVIHFDSPLPVPEGKWVEAMLPYLPEDIRIMEVKIVSNDFHARYQTKQKEYRYRMLNRTDQDVFRRHITYHVPHTLDVEAMKQACLEFEGTHDFTSFCSKKTTLKGDKIRTVYKAEIQEVDDELLFRFVGSGFLYNMVRIMVGTLLEVGKGKRNAADIKKILQEKDRDKAGKTVPPHGLFLWKVDY